MGETYDFGKAKLKKITPEAMMEIIKQTPEDRLGEIVEKYHDILTFKGQKLDAETTKAMLTLIKMNSNKFK